MLLGAYPDGIPKSEYFAVLYVLSIKGEMSNRSVAKAIGCMNGESYTLFHYDVAHDLPNRTIDSNLIDSVIEKLNEHGYADWLKEE